MDYLGESGIGRAGFEGELESFLPGYPWHQAYCGDLDLCGFKRPQSFYRDVVWGIWKKPYIAVHPPLPEGKKEAISFWGWPDVWPNWNWPGLEGKELTVDVYAEADEVELFLNNRPLGVQPCTRKERLTATFVVPYQPGILKAVCRKNGKITAENEIQTTGQPARLSLAADRGSLPAGRPGLVYVTVEILDEAGHLHPTADQPIFFTVQGVGKILAVGNGNPQSEEMYIGNQRNSFRGRCLVALRTTGEPGELVLRAQADGLPPAEEVIAIG
jgi:beta-galactosidase